MSKFNNPPGFDSIRPGQRIGTVGVVGRGCRHFALDADQVRQMLHGSPFYPHDQAKPFDIQPITMSNSEAIEALTHIEADIYGRIAIRKAIDALSNPWVSLDERLPVKSDALYCSVLVWSQYGVELISYNQLYFSPSTLAKYTHFLPIPPLPEVEE